MTISVRIIPASRHLEFIRSQASASFLQTPAWGTVKSEWNSESLGWFDSDNQMIGAGLVLYRKVPRVDRYLAYLPEGPVKKTLIGKKMELLPGIRHVEEMHGHGSAVADIIPPVLARPEVHPPVHLTGIGGNDLPPPAPGQAHRQPGLAAAARPCQREKAHRRPFVAQQMGLVPKILGDRLGRDGVFFDKGVNYHLFWGYYVAARAQWNPDIDPVAATEEAFDLCCGQAAGS